MDFTAFDGAGHGLFVHRLSFAGGRAGAVFSVDGGAFAQENSWMIA